MRTCECPGCGANIAVTNEDRDFVFCQYCGSKLMLDDYRSTQRIIDEARIRQAENEKTIRLKELALEEARQRQRNTTRRVLMTIWIILSLLILGICLVKWIVLDDSITGLLLLYVAAAIIGGGAHLIFKIIPEKEQERELVQKGGIRFPKGLQPFSEQNYIAVRQALEIAGFCNITCINMHDVTFGLLLRPGMVESISVNGIKVTEGGKVYPPDAAITIVYHDR